MNSYERLKQIQKDYPKLTFDNNGYQYIKAELELHKEQVKEIESILKDEIKGFVRFNNFKPRRDGTFAVRCQYQWSSQFTGVGYFNIEDFNPLNNK